MGWRIGDEIPDELVEIEPSTRNKSNNKIFIDTASTSSIRTVICVLVGLIAIHLFTASRVPPMISHQDEFFSLNETNSNLSVDIDITLSQLEQSHKFVSVNCSLKRKNTSQEETSRTVGVSSRMVFMNGKETIDSATVPHQSLQAVFLPDSSFSSIIPVIHKEIQNFDSVQIKTTLKCDFTGVEGINFRWSFSNPSALTYSKVSCIIMSVLILYMVMVSVSRATFHEKYTEVFCIILGIIGIVASNPFSLIIHNEKMKFIDHICMYYFIALFRYFLFMQIELIRSHRTSPDVITSVIFGIFFVVYAAIDADASYERAQFLEGTMTVSDTILPSETKLMYAHIAYSVICFIWMVLAFTQAKDHIRRLIVFECFVLVGLFTSIFSQVLCPKMELLMFSVLRPLTNTCVHMTMAAFAIFLLHQHNIIEYEQMAGDADNGGALDVEVMSSGEEIEEDETEEDESAET